MKLRNFTQLMDYSEAGIVTSENNLTWEGLRLKKFANAHYYLDNRPIVENSHYGWLLLHKDWREELSDEDNASTPNPDCVMVMIEDDDSEDWFLLWEIEDID